SVVPSAAKTTFVSTAVRSMTCVLPAGWRRATPSGHLLVGLGELRTVQLGVSAALGHQLVMRAALDDAALLHHQDQVGASDGREAVGDDEAGALAPQGDHRLLQEQLGPGVDRAGGL